MPDEPEPRDGDGPAERLARYRAKRSADRTPEPFGGEEASVSPEAAAALLSEPKAGPAWAVPRLFCVQKHAATRLHYDFRVEIGGVLRSWAVPRGPSLDPNDKRMAVEVEDHPVEYADFEGKIPEGNYGAGEVIVWDKGLWIPLENPEETLPKGKLTFELRGYKLRGAWHLFRTKGTGKGKGTSKEWMLVKRADGWASATRALPQESIYSGLTLEEIRTGSLRAAEVRAELARLGAARRELRAADVKLMLAETAEKPFTDPAWLFELKYDGYRVLAERQGGATHLVYRRGSDAISTYPDVARALAALPFGDLVLDGEVVVLDEEGRPSFQRLQRRAQQRRTTDILRAALEMPATYFAFDLLGFEGFDLRALPLVERKRLLQLVLPRAGPVRFLDHVPEQGEAFYVEVSRLKLEGLVAKRADAPYRAGRSPLWQKLRTDRVDDFVVVGFTEPQGGRTGFGALHLAAFEGRTLVYCGRAGSGFDEEQLVSLREALEAERRDEPACTGPLPTDRGHVWVEPRRVAEVRYLTWTAEGLLRQPVFLRLRDDKRPDECPMPLRCGTEEDADTASVIPRSAVSPGDEESAGAETAAPSAPDATGAPRDDMPFEKKVPFSNLKKIFWPDEGYTKGDLIEYYRAISPWLLPYLKDRLLVLTRFPDGIRGKSFFQKDAPSFAPGWVRLERVWSESAQREIDYFVAGDVESLLYIANLGTIPLHVWGSRISSLAHPDWCILDLDPKTAPFLHVVQVARAIHDLSEEIGLPAYVKTSGSTGLHVLVPLGGLCTFDQCKQLGELLARVVAGRIPDIATTIRLPNDRGGRVYIDFLQNGHGKLLAAPFTARPVPGAFCSAPLLWDEVDETLELGRFTIKTLPERMSVFGRDPLASVLTQKPDLVTALARLSARLS
jgi:bifunctional non-homologous end joining protein LigD